MTQRNLLQLTSEADAERYRSLGLWRDETIYERVRAASIGNLEKPAIVMGESRWTYAAVLDAVDALALHLLSLNLPQGGVVAVQLPNGPGLPILHLALNRIGLLVMPMYYGYRDLEITHLLRQAEVSAAIIPAASDSHDYPAMWTSIRRDVASLSHVLPIGEVWDVVNRTMSQAGDRLSAHRPVPDELAHIMLSSGTTSLPKISVFSNNNLLAMVDAFGSMAGLSSEDIGAALAPMGTGATGYVFPVLAPLCYGATSVILDRWSDPGIAVDLVVSQRCTFATAIPTQMAQMVSSIEQHEQGDFADFRCFNNAGAPLPAEVGHSIEALMGCRVQSIYGSTDGGVPCMTSTEDPPEKRIATVGRVLPGRLCEVRTPGGELAESGEVGEICWRTPDKSYGYLNDIEASRAVFDEQGFYCSGDLGCFDGDGYLRIVGRAKDMVLRGGRNISPLLIEEHLIAHPSVREVAVAAMPHPTLGEQACAFVVLQDGHSLDLASAIAFLKERKLPVWQLPERLEPMSELPSSAGGKVVKGRLTEWITEKLKLEQQQ